MPGFNDRIEALRPNRKKPTNYPFLLFHGIRTGQLLAAMITGAIMYYFLWHLRHGNWSIPWTFIFIASAASGTILALTATIVLHCCHGLNPGLNVTLNSALAVVWTLGFALLSWYASPTLGHHCSLMRWHEEAGQMVCRIYKALYAFTVLGFVSTLAALILDVYVLRNALRLGRYNQMEDLDDKRGFPLQDNGAWRTSTDVFLPGAAHHPSGQQAERTKAFGDERKALQGDGYALPEEQFGRYDTEYRGGGGIRRSNDGM